MNRWLDRLPHSAGDRKVKALEVAGIAGPAVLVLLLEFLRPAVLQDISLVTWGASLFVAVLISAFLSHKVIFGRIDRLRRARMRELETLADVNRAVDRFHNFDSLLNVAMHKLLDITAAHSGELYLVDEQTRELVHALHGGSADRVPGQDSRLQLEKRLVDDSARLNQPIIVKTLDNASSEPLASLASAGIGSLAVVPLKSQSATVGIVSLSSPIRGQFAQGQANLLLGVGNRIAVAIEKARLYERVQAVAVVEERERISAELHDGLAQILGYVITKSQATRQLLRKITAANDYLVELENVAQDVYTDTREQILGLRTATSGDRSMVSALRESAARFSQMHGIKTEFVTGDRLIPSLPPHIELQAIRIVQEALSNIRKHAEATRATIRIDAGDDQVTIVAEDDGKGFDVDEVGKRDWPRFGLRNMKERAHSIHCELSVESSPERGTRIVLSIPLTSSRGAVEEGKENEGTHS